jgi:hypothetical protein
MIFLATQFGCSIRAAAAATNLFPGSRGKLKKKISRTEEIKEEGDSVNDEGFYDTLNGLCCVVE